MEQILDKLLETFSEFTWRRFFALIAICILMFLAFTLFERYTSSFRLSRLQKSAELIVKINEMEKSTANASQEITRARKEVIKQTIEAIETKPLSFDFIPTTLKFSLDSLWKFLAGSALLLIFAIFKMPKTIKGDEQSKNALFGLLFFSIITGAFANLFPPIWWPWGHIFIYPMIVLTLFFIFFVLPLMFLWRKPKSEDMADNDA